MADYDKNLEIHGLAFKTLGILNELEKCVSALRDGFLNSTDFTETKKTIQRLQLETLQLDKDVVEALNHGKNSKTQPSQNYPVPPLDSVTDGPIRFEGDLPDAPSSGCSG